MSRSEIILSNVRCVGIASCVGGLALHPALGDYPLLCWSAIDPIHPGKVMLSVGGSTVEQVAIDAAITPFYDALAAKHKTTIDHVHQAIAYALAAHFLESK